MKIFSFEELLNPSTSITYQKVLDKHNDSPKRICFNSCHKTAFKAIDYNDVKWAINLPFEETIGKILTKETGFSLIKTRYGYWVPLKIESEYEQALVFKDKYKHNVFLRDNLDLSVALSEHYDSEGERTYLGELEYKAKWYSCSKSRKKIANQVIEFINSTPYYKDCTHICAVPSSQAGKKNLPMKLARKVASISDIIDISSQIEWTSEKGQLKELSFEERWDELEVTGLNINIEDKPKSVILLDDLYQSGTTLQFIAMKLKNAGIKKVYGLTIVKARKDTDNS